MITLLTSLVLLTPTSGVTFAPVNALAVTTPATVVFQGTEGSAETGDEASKDGESKEDQKGSGKAPACGGSSQLLFILVFFGIFYFLMIRPQSKKAKAHQQLISELKKGDEVVTQGGILGRVSGFDDETGAIVLEIAKNTQIRVTRNHVAGFQSKSAEESEDKNTSSKSDEKKSDKSSDSKSGKKNKGTKKIKVNELKDK
jgi:preprotein translocase subunit YajC